MGSGEKRRDHGTEVARVVDDVIFVHLGRIGRIIMGVSRSGNDETGGRPLRQQVLVSVDENVIAGRKDEKWVGRVRPVGSHGVPAAPDRVPDQSRQHST